MAKVGQLDVKKWEASVKRAIDDVRVGNKPLGAAEIETVAKQLAPQLDQLQTVNAAQRVGLFMEAVLKSASYEEMLGILAARNGRSVNDIRGDIVSAMRNVSAGPVRAADEPSKVELKTIFEKAGLGKVMMGVEDITRIPADVSIVPQLSSGDPTKGGGGRGGIALSWERLAKQQDEATSGGATGLLRAVNAYDLERGKDYLPHGTTIPAPTGLGDRSIGPAMLLHIASVPASELTLKAAHQYPTEDAFKAHQNARMAFVEDMLRRSLFSLRRAVQKDESLTPSAEHPIRVTLPALCTGPKGAVDFQECGAVMGRVLREFQKENAGFEFVIGLWDDGHDPLSFRDKRTAFAEAFVNDALQDKFAAQYEPNSVILNKLTNGLDRAPDAGKGKTLNDAYLTQKLDDWTGAFLGKLDKLDAHTIADRSLGVTQFNDRIQAELFWQLHKFAEVPALAGVDKAGLGEVTAERMKAVLARPDIRQKLFDVIKDQLQKVADKPNAFAGDDKMSEVLTAGLAHVLQQVRYRHLEAFHEDLSQKMSGAQERVTKLEAALVGTVDKGDYEKLKAQLRSSEENARAFKRSSEGFERELKRLVGKSEQLEGKVTELTQALSDQRTLAASFRQRAEAIQTSAYRAPTGRSG